MSPHLPIKYNASILLKKSVRFWGKEDKIYHDRSSFDLLIHVFTILWNDCFKNKAIQSIISSMLQFIN